MNQVKAAAEKFLPEAQRFLLELISHPSISGTGEQPVQELVAERLAPFGQVEKVAVPESIKQDPEYTFASAELD
ncbi:MAG TPA: hypothetical protein PKW42_07010, partial [bacterium]|nr:hypothetical protein [bacterium]